MNDKPDDAATVTAMMFSAYCLWMVTKGLKIVTPGGEELTVRSTMDMFLSEYSESATPPGDIFKGDGP